jgi:hypothetical protein
MSEEEKRKRKASLWDDNGAVACRNCKHLHYFSDLRQIWENPIVFPNAPDISVVSIPCSEDSKWYQYKHEDMRFPVDPKREANNKLDLVLARLNALESQITNLKIDLTTDFDTRIQNYQTSLKKFFVENLASKAQNDSSTDPKKDNTARYTQ